jgi:hypothetical protein
MTSTKILLEQGNIYQSFSANQTIKEVPKYNQIILENKECRREKFS